MTDGCKPKSEDVRLALAFIPDPARRADVMVLYAFLETLREIPERVTEPLMGEIRLRWWYEALEEIRDGRAVRYHPLTEALQTLVQQYVLPVEDFLALVEGQMPLLDTGALPLKTALAVVEAGEGTIARLAALILEPEADAHALLAPVRFYGLAYLQMSGRLAEAGPIEGAHLKRDAAQAAKTLPPSLMPLALPAVLAEAAWMGRQDGPLKRRLKLLWAYMTGRF